MKLLTALLAPLVLVVSMSVADAAEKKGTITAIDAEAQTLSLNKWHFQFKDAEDMADLEVGDSVKVYFDIKNNNTYVVKRVKVLD